MKKLNLTKTRDGQRNSSIQSYFFGENLADENTLNEVKAYLTCWLEEYNNSLTFEEIEEMIEDFDGSFSYDVYSFELIEDEQEDFELIEDN